MGSLGTTFGILTRLFFLFAITSSFVATIPTMSAATSLDDVQAAAAEVARVRAETVQIESEWSWQRETLGASIEAVEQRVRTLEQKGELLEAKFAVEERQIDNLADEVAQVRAMYEKVDTQLSEVAAEVVGMVQWFPPRLARAVELPCQTLADPDLSPGERMQHIVTVWSRCLQFNRSITYSEETLSLESEGKERLMDVIYWGTSHAYALDRDSSAAYLGYPAEAGWKWEATPAIAAAVEKVIAIYQDRADPQFVSVPVRTTNVGDAAGR